VTDIQTEPEFDYERARRQVERAVGAANVAVGLLLVIGALGLAVHWRLRFGGYGGLRAFYLHASWAFGALELLAAAGMLRRWPARWILELLPLAVPVVAYQYFIMHFIFHRF
jgi:hypothetical protein